MKKILLLPAALLLLISCGVITPSSAQKKTSHTKKPALPVSPVVGGDRDAHGCIGSAGYVWSQLRKTCIRTFETADARLKSLDNTASYTSSAPVLFSKDKSRAEVYLPGTHGSIILKGSKAGMSWKNDSLQLTARNGYVLKLRGKAIYSGE